MEHLSIFVYLLFGATVLITIWLFLKASNYSKTFLLLTAVWILLQSILGLSGFYNNPDTMTIRFPLLFLPAVVFIIFLFITKKGKLFIDDLDLKTLTLIHTIRILVEIVLFMLFINKSIPEAMTFEGSNFDILSGLSAPIIYYYGFVKNKIGKPVLLAWNIACVLLLLFVVSNAVLALPARFEQFDFEQPNRALGYFPFILLPAFLVPLVLFSNLAAIRQLIIVKTVTTEDNINQTKNTY